MKAQKIIPIINKFEQLSFRNREILIELLCMWIPPIADSVLKYQGIKKANRKEIISLVKKYL